MLDKETKKHIRGVNFRRAYNKRVHSEIKKSGLLELCVDPNTLYMVDVIFVRYGFNYDILSEMMQNTTIKSPKRMSKKGYKRKHVFIDKRIEINSSTVTDEYITNYRRVMYEKNKDLYNFLKNRYDRRCILDVRQTV